MPRSNSTGLVVRDARAADIAAVARIYSHHVLNGLASFEEEAPSVEEMATRFERVLAGGYPYLVGELDGAIVGYAYASAYRARSAYRFTLEDSVYVDASAAGRGVGTRLLEALLERCAQGPWKQVVAVIGDSANHASINLHAKLGFERVGVLRNVGFKFGRWVDSVLMQRALSR